MARRGTKISQRWAPFGLAFCVALPVVSSGFAAAQERLTETQILDALKSHAPKRSMRLSSADQERAADERRLIESLIKKTSRTITIEDRRKVAEIVKEKPNIDLEIAFDYNSASISPQAMPTLQTLGRALSSDELGSDTFLVAGHTDAAGGDTYNQTLSERRADAVMRFLTEHFKLSREHLLAIGFGKSQLKNAAVPLSAENRRVQIVNTEIR
jgi:outer membrane protein OmpA-like peptidoglycan-associated protein